MNAAQQIRSRRLAAGISQRQLALRAGTSSATLSRYEAGTIDPSMGTLHRILLACAPRRRRWPSLGEVASAIARELLAERSTDAWRLVGEVLDDEAGSDDAETRQFLSEMPMPSGDPRADASMSALAEYLSLRRGMTPPPWTQISVEALPWWFVAGDPFSAVALRESPPSFARRGIFITAGALERV